MLCVLDSLFLLEGCAYFFFSPSLFCYIVLLFLLGRCCRSVVSVLIPRSTFHCSTSDISHRPLVNHATFPLDPLLFGSVDYEKFSQVRACSRLGGNEMEQLWLALARCIRAPLKSVSTCIPVHAPCNILKKKAGKGCHCWFAK